MYYIKPTVYKQPKCNPAENTVQFSSVDLSLEHFFISIVHMEKLHRLLQFVSKPGFLFQVKAVKHSVA
jgi:hypothetical protein